MPQANGGSSDGRQRRRTPTLATDERLRQRALARAERDILARTSNLREGPIALDAGGREILTKIGEVDQIGFTRDEVQALIGRADTLVHNHDDNSPFSEDDYTFTAVVQPRQMVVFGPRTRWRLVRSGATWPDVPEVLRALRRTDRRIQRELFQQKQREAFSGDPFLWADRGGHVWARLQ